jgi:hypothetical protein
LEICQRLRRSKLDGTTRVNPLERESAKEPRAAGNVSYQLLLFELILII